MEADRPPLQLSNREYQLIQLASRGLTDTAIAHQLGISEATVGTYWGRVRIKIGPYNRTELVSIYLRAQQREALDAIREENAKLVAEIKVAASAPSEQASLYEALIENAPDAIVLVSEQGTIVSSNRAGHEMFGYEGGEMVGLPLIRLIPERFREIHQRHRSDYVADPSRRAMGEHLQTAALRKDGLEFLVRAALSALPTPHGMLVTCVLRAVEDGRN